VIIVDFVKGLWMIFIEVLKSFCEEDKDEK
jgi:hypothetical protein